MLYSVSGVLLIAIVVNVSYGGATFFHESSSDVIRAEDGRIRGFSFHNNSNLVLGALFAIHDPSSSGECSEALDDSGLESVEAFLYAIDRINSDSNLLPDISLGYDVRDTCVLENIALDEAIGMLFDEGEFSNIRCESSSDFNATERKMIGVIGPTTSEVAVPLAGLLRLFHVPQISYSATSITLSNRDRYGYFYRTIPPDDLQAQAMVDLLLKFDWSLVSILHSNNEYGEAGSERFRKIASSVGICIDLDLGIDDDFLDQDFYDTASTLYHDSSAEVIVFFASRNFISPFMKQFGNVTSNFSVKRGFIWIASESWSQANDIVNKYNDIVAGRLWGLAPLSKQNESLYEFENYFSELTLHSNRRNPWFIEYFEQHDGCGSNASACPQNISLNRTATPFKVQLVIESVYSMAHAIYDYLIDNCPDSQLNVTCSQQQLPVLNGSIIRQYLQNVTFTSPFGKQIYFDSSGNPEGNYDITSYQLIDNDALLYDFIKVGVWEGSAPSGSRLQMFDNITYQFGFDEFNEPIKSIHSSCQACSVGEVKIAVPSSCCGVCYSCIGRNYSNSSKASTCEVCPDGTWGNDPTRGSNSCQTIEESFLNVSDNFGIFLTVLASIGLILVATTALLMAILWNTPVIKSSGREQMILLLSGVMVCFLQTAFFLMKPMYAVCFFQRAGTWFCFSIILSALLVKLVRITRIFLRSKTSKPPRFIQPQYQVLLSLILVAIQMGLVLISLLTVYPESTTMLLLNENNTNNHPVLLLQCATPHEAMFVILLLYYSLMLVVSNALAVVTIKFPDNFNEVRYVAFTTFSVGLVWIAFCVSYFATKPEHHTALFSFGIQMSAIAVLFCFFLPRIFGAVVMKYFTKKDLYTSTFGTGSSSSTSSNRLSSLFSVQMSSENAAPPMNEVATTETFKQIVP